MAEATQIPSMPSPEQVAEYLRNHPDFFHRFGHLLESMTPPEVQHGGNVVDLQHHMLGRLQNGLQDMRRQFEGLILSSRDNMSTLHQVHEAVLLLLRAQDMERLLEIVTMDLPALFNVDVVRLGIESQAAAFFTTRLGDASQAGVAFLDVGAAEEMLGKNRQIRIVSDTEKEYIGQLESLFSDCVEMVASAVLVRLRLPSSQQEVVLAFGVRIRGHFHPGQGTEMLAFLAQVLEHRLDEALQQSGLSDIM